MPTAFAVVGARDARRESKQGTLVLKFDLLGLLAYR